MIQSRGRAKGFAAAARLMASALIACAIVSALVALAPGEPPGDAPAAGATVREAGKSAFTQHVPELTNEQLQTFALGNRIFSTDWIEAPASVELFDGLGPYYTRRSCAGCHPHDGRGLAPSGEANDEGVLVIGLARQVGDSLLPDPRYGEQLSERALPGLAPEGRVVVRWREQPFHFPDGESASLRAPEYEVKGLPFGPLAADTRLRPRLAPALPGLGLLEAIPDSALLAREDPDDQDGDGISGRAHRVSEGDSGTARVGRFGWKADRVTILDQVARALRLDIGITSDVFPVADLTAAETLAAKRPQGGAPEIEEGTLAAIVDYCAMLAVPARRNPADSAVVRGAGLFEAANCNACHGGSYTTDGSEFTALSKQRIQPGTDLLLHDMGAALAEPVSEPAVSGAEWRTPPLWGLGLHERVSGYRTLLHDGRARTLVEAILWHGGEARESRDRFIHMTADERRQLIAFLESL